MNGINSNQNQFIPTDDDDVTLRGEAATQGVRLEESPPASPTSLQRFCQKVGPIFTARSFCRFLAAAVIMTAVSIGGPAFLGSLIIVIIVEAILYRSNMASNEPFFDCMKLSQPNIVSP